MSETLLAMSALVAGIALGAALVATIVFAYRQRSQARRGAVVIPPELTGTMDALEDAAALIDDSSIVHAVSASAAWLGVQRGEVLEQAGLSDIVRRARATGVTQTHTLRIKRGRISDESRLVIARAARIGPRLTLLTVRDISEQERLQQMRQDFIANTSHELKTPVGAIGLLSEAMESAIDNPDQVRIFASRIAAEAARLGNLTGRIMNLSKLQAADELTEANDVSIDEVVVAAIEQYQVQAEAADVTIIRGGDRGLFVRGSATILTDALGNLVANAVAYSPAGSRVGIGVRGTREAVDIAVTDQGIGIAETDQQRIFERFYRADQARSRRTGGTGLGLAIVKHAVSRHGGDVRLWSQPGRGSTFTIRLPRIDSPLDVVADRGRRKKLKKAKTPVEAITPAPHDPESETR